MIAKEMVRKQQLEYLQTRTLTGKILLDQSKLLQKLYQSREWQEAKMIALTFSLPHELNTRPLIMQAFLEDKRVCLPRVFPNRQMKFGVVTPTTQLECSRLGILEPSMHAAFVESTEIDMILVPGLAFSARGHRVGYGGGYYDRYLQTYAGKTIALAEPGCFFKKENWQVEADDVAIQKIITV